MRKDGERFPVLITPAVPRGKFGAPLCVVATIKDMSELRRAEAALRASEEMRDVAEGVARVGSWRWDVRTGEVTWSPHMHVLYDADVDKDFGGDLEALLDARIHPDDREKVRADLASLTGPGTPPPVEWRVVHGDGSLHVIRSSATVVRDRDGVPTMIVGYGQDVTEAVAVEAELRESEAMRDLAESVAELGSWRWERGSHEVALSSGMHRLFDIDPGSFDGDFMTVFNTRVHPDDRAALRQAMKAFDETGAVPPPLEYRLVHRDGAEHIVHGESRVEHNDESGVVSLVGYFQDVTRQRQAEATLRDARERLDFVLRSAAVGTWDWDIPSDLATWDETAAALYGMAPGRLAGPMASFYPTVHADDLGGLVAAIESCRLTAAPYEAEFRVVHADGTVAFLAERGRVARDSSGRPARMSGVTWNVTERRHHESEIRRLNAELEGRVASRTAQLEMANKELEAFAYSVSHDLRAPLRAIDGFSAMVADDAADRLTSDEVEHLQRVRAGAQRMALLIEELLDLSRVSRRDMLCEDVDLSGLAISLLDELREAHPDRNVVTVVAPGMRAEADEALLRVILANLLGNAWKFTSAHEEARIEVGVTGSGGERAFFVRDDGAGFDMQYAAHLFGAFQRMHPGGAFEGDGIGLATVQRLVRRHGGRVWAEAEIEKGATFYFTLPAATATA